MTRTQPSISRRNLLQHAATAGAVGAITLYAPAVIGASWDNVFENLDIDIPGTLDGSKWNNTLIRNCTFHDISTNALTIRSVENVLVENCRFENIGENAIHLSITGSGSKDVTLYNNTIVNCGGNGITGGQRYWRRLDQENYQVIGNHVENTGLSAGSSGKLHGIYVQAQDFVIRDNTVINATDGNGISVRSSGLVRNNTVNGTAKSGIAYYADHMRGPSNQLLIEDNMVSNVGQKTSRTGIDLLNIPKRRYAVRKYILRDNSFGSGVNCQQPVKVNSDYNSWRYTVVIQGNQC